MSRTFFPLVPFADCRSIITQSHSPQLPRSWKMSRTFFPPSLFADCPTAAPTFRRTLYTATLSNCCPNFRRTLYDQTAPTSVPTADGLCPFKSLNCTEQLCAEKQGVHFSMPCFPLYTMHFKPVMGWRAPPYILSRSSIDISTDRMSRFCNG